MSERQHGTEREAKAPGPTAARCVSEASDHVSVPVHPAHNAGRPAAERGEGSAGTTEHARPAHTCPTPRGTGVSQGVAGGRHAARERTREPFPARLHPRTGDVLRARFSGRTRHAAPGVEGVPWQAYASGLEERRAALHRRVHRGA